MLPWKLWEKNRQSTKAGNAVFCRNLASNNVPKKKRKKQGGIKNDSINWEIH